MRLVLLLFCCVIILPFSFCQVRLPRLIRDSMVLQRDTKIKVWGWASPNEKVSIGFLENKYVTISNANGDWMIELPPMSFGGPYKMTIDGSNHIVIKDILVGDVWLCSGQSNMAHQLAVHAERYKNEIDKDNYPSIRQFLVPNDAAPQHPYNDLKNGNWVAATGNVKECFSTVAYFFAKAIYEKNKVPIGIINSSVGGTRIESWIGETGFSEFSKLQNIIQKNKDTNYFNQIIYNESTKSNIQPKQSDKGLTDKYPWYSLDYIPKHWRNITVPGYWEDQGVKNLRGVVWYRKEVEIPSSMNGKPVKIALGRIIDADIVYLNGKQIGATYYQYPQRRYTIPSGLLHSGKNVLVVRITSNGEREKGGFVPDKPYYLALGNDTISLKGDWMYKVGSVFEPQKNPANSFSKQSQPAALFNGMIAPLVNYSIKGIVWYQGESNVGNATDYEKLLPSLIINWRQSWHQENLPFLFVQLPNYGNVQYKPYESATALLRNNQFKALTIPNTGMAVTIDLGEWNDIHPDRKKEVGDRLAIAARRLVYGETALVASGPLYKSSTIDGSKIIVSFNEVGKGLIANDGEALSEFAIAGDDKVFVWANASIKGNQVVVWNDEVANPKYVRYAWSDNPDNPNLYNKDGLPASPFTNEK